LAFLNWGICFLLIRIGLPKYGLSPFDGQRALLLREIGPRVNAVSRIPSPGLTEAAAVARILKSIACS
jgi:hypothetical protein